MTKRLLIVLGVLAVVVAASALSGCTSTNTGSSSTSPTTHATTSTSPSSSSTSSGAKVPVTVSGNTITITGTKGSGDKDQVSDQFTLETGTYIMSVTNKGGSSLGDTFIATIESPTGDVYTVLSPMGNSKGGYLPVYADNIMAKPGPAVLKVSMAGTYTVTLTKPTSGEALPLKITGAPGEQVIKAVDLKAGAVTINVKHLGYNSAEQGTTMVNLVKADTGQSVRLDGAWVTGETRDVTGDISDPGVYVLSVSFRAHTNGEATISQ